MILLRSHHSLQQAQEHHCRCVAAVQMKLNLDKRFPSITNQIIKTPYKWFSSECCWTVVVCLIMNTIKLIHFSLAIGPERDTEELFHRWKRRICSVSAFLFAIRFYPLLFQVEHLPNAKQPNPNGFFFFFLFIDNFYILLWFETNERTNEKRCTTANFLLVVALFRC